MAPPVASLCCRRLGRRRRLAARVLAAVAAASCGVGVSGFVGDVALAQPKAPHYRYRIDMPPGEIGRQQLERGGPLLGYYQPVEIRAPRGSMVSLAVGGAFEPPQPCPVVVGLLIGHAYRIKVTGIPLQEGSEVFPTIEVIDRLYPPPGEEARFPIPIELTGEELDMALRGRHVTRVIYLEEPATALPRLENPDWQRCFEVKAEQDPLEVADRLGRPVAIMRMGSRIPDPAGADERFLHGAPPWLRYSAAAASRSAAAETTEASGSQSRNGSISELSPNHRESGEARRARTIRSP